MGCRRPVAKGDSKRTEVGRTATTGCIGDLSSLKSAPSYRALPNSVDARDHRRKNDLRCRENLDEYADEEIQSRLPFPSIETSKIVDDAIVGMMLTDRGDRSILVSRDGRVHIYEHSTTADPRLIDSIPLDLPKAQFPTTASRLLGRGTMMVGDSSGQVLGSSSRRLKIPLKKLTLNAWLQSTGFRLVRIQFSGLCHRHLCDWSQSATRLGMVPSLRADG